MSKRLIINADDYGLTEDANRRIMECRKKGAVSDISILAVGRFFRHAAELAEKNGINKLGVHLTMIGPFKAMTSVRFSGNYLLFLAAYFVGLFNRNSIYKEFKSQILRVKNAGFTITHLDTHQHIHAVPGILKIVIKLAKEEGIGWVRFAQENLGVFAKLKDPRGLVRNMLLRGMCVLSKGLLKASGVRHNDYFKGHARALRFKREDFFRALAELKDGLTELGCHPGECEEERNVLCDKGFLDEIKKRSIELVSY